VRAVLAYEFGHYANSNIDAAMVPRLARCEWIKKGLPLCLIGDTGTGKSHLLIALGTEGDLCSGLGSPSHRQST
jgi:DNA replication protein DnaC